MTTKKYIEAGKIYSINISKKKGGKKTPVPEALIGPLGLKGDGHSGDWHRQVSLLSWESIKSFNEMGSIKADPGDFAENLTTTGIKLNQLKIGDRLAISRHENLEDLDLALLEIPEKCKADGNKDVGPVLLEVTQIGKECLKPCSIYYQVGKCIMPVEGIFCRVLRPGQIKPNYHIFVL